MRGSLKGGTFNLVHYLRERLGAEGKAVATDTSLGTLAVLGDLTLAGTDTGGAAAQFLILAGTKAAWGGDAILSHLRLEAVDDVRDIRWIHPQLALVAMGEGKLRLIALDPASSELRVHGTLPAIHTAAIREIAVNLTNRAQFASGGYDRRLCLVDLERPDALQTIHVDGVIGSIRWPLCNQNVCPSLTLDDGTFLIYDIRTRPVGPPAFKATMGKKELYAHDRHTDHNVFLGFGDGEIQQIDVRVTDRVLHRVQDPFVQAIGDMRWSGNGQDFAVFGIPAVTLWRMKPDGSLGILGSHQAGAGKPVDDGLVHIGEFSSANTLLWTAGPTLAATEF
jgi:hypothetical protein